MAEQRVNAAGETVELNEETDRWEPVKSEKAEPLTVRVEDETIASKDASTTTPGFTYEKGNK